VFLAMMVIGLVGLVMMALPALGGHHLPSMHGHGHGVGLGHHAGHLAAGHQAGSSVGGPHGAASGVGVGATHGQTAAIAAPASSQSHLPLVGVAHASRRLIPSPRAVFSMFALYGAFGNALVHAAHLSVTSAALIAIGPALLVEWVLIRPIWNLMFRFRADASSPLEELILAEAQAVVPFRNGQGVITTVRDGRRVQLHARLCDQDAALPVAFGQLLRIEDVEARRERVTVSVISNGKRTNHPIDKPI
jgi:hypothetical protein